MKKIRFIILLAFGIQLMAAGYCSSQSPFTVTKATSQRWSGGVVGHHGITYNIEIQTKLKTFTPDTVWINNICYSLDFLGRNENFTRQIDSATHLITFTISVGESQFYRRGVQFTAPKDTTITTEPSKKEIRQFAGAAMIEYRIKRKHYYYIIKSFTQLKPLNYP